MTFTESWVKNALLDSNPEGRDPRTDRGIKLNTELLENLSTSSLVGLRNVSLGTTNLREINTVK